MPDKSKILKTLTAIGFSEKEAKVYVTVLELNEALPSSISRLSGVKRPNTYLILEQLQKKGLLSHVKKDSHLYYRAVDPKTFIDQEVNKSKTVESSLKELKTALPDLFSLHQDAAQTPQMSVYKGKAGLIQIMEDTLTTKTELLCWANPTVVFSLLEDYYPTYIKKKVKRKIWLRGIFCRDEIGERFKAKGKDELREVYLIPKDEYPFKNEINIYDDKVTIISHEDQIGVIIQNKNIADTQRAIFNLAYNLLKKRDIK